VTRRIRFRFSLATLLLAVSWFAGAVWMNVTPRVDLVHIPDHSALRILCTCHGWPWTLHYGYDFLAPSGHLPLIPSGVWRCWALAGDIAVGLLLVVVLTWGSNQLLRRVGARLRRRSAAKEQA
jgi:hypothetical protein